MILTVTVAYYNAIWRPAKLKCSIAMYKPMIITTTDYKHLFFPQKTKKKL